MYEQVRPIAQEVELWLSLGVNVWVIVAGVFLLIRKNASPEMLRKALKLGGQAALFVVGVLVGMYALDALDLVKGAMPR
jgi:hypothetical protein